LPEVASIVEEATHDIVVEAADNRSRRYDNFRGVSDMPMVAAISGLLLPIAALAAPSPRPPVVAPHSETVVDEDVVRFWQAYDAIRATADQAERLKLIQTLYIDPGTPGLHALMEARHYTAKQYVDAIIGWPKFWASVRPLTSRSQLAAATLTRDVDRFRSLYPELKPATITYAVGVLRTGGTTLGNQVLIGAELALGDESVDTTELAEPLRSRLNVFFKSRPFANNAQNNIHEYVHTQQQETQGSLLQQATREGVAELVAELITNRKPALPVYSYGPAHDKQVRIRFMDEMTKDDYSNWLWNSADNAFGVSDMGYYVGYRIARSYYDKAHDKRRAIKEMIELKYDDANAVRDFAVRSGYLGR
jgi:hypothetical protein